MNEMTSWLHSEVAFQSRKGERIGIAWKASNSVAMMMQDYIPENDRSEIITKLGSWI